MYKDTLSFKGKFKMNLFKFQTVTILYYIQFNYFIKETDILFSKYRSVSKIAALLQTIGLGDGWCGFANVLQCELAVNQSVP
jgi:hypothetical protein